MPGNPILTMSKYCKNKTPWDYRKVTFIIVQCWFDLKNQTANQNILSLPRNILLIDQSYLKFKNLN